MLSDLLSRRVIARLRRENAELLAQLVDERALRMAARDEQQKLVDAAYWRGVAAGAADALAKADD